METFEVRTFGCQMNKHDSERVTGMLISAGMTPTTDTDEADLIVFMTCCVRENADTRALGQAASLKAHKEARPGALLALGGCIGQRDGEAVLRAVPHLDIVFGTHNIGRLPELIAQAEVSDLPIIEVIDSGDDFVSDLPASRERTWHAWLPITVGCNNYCTYCIVPFVRGVERSRPLETITREASCLVADGVKEITLLGQNVNSYGRDIYGDTRFAETLVAVAETGIERIRFATSHPKDLSPDTIDVLANVDAVCPYLHLPVQSGSDRILQAMNRRYTRDHYLGLVDTLYDTIPGLALSTDVIVGFPGETDQDFADTLDLVERSRLDQAFTFIYSPREGTPAASMGNRVPREVSQTRFDRLVEIVHASAQAKNDRLVGTTTDVLFEGRSKRDHAMLTGRTPTNKVVHVPAGGDPNNSDAPDTDTPTTVGGTTAPVLIEEAHTWFLKGSLAT